MSAKIKGLIHNYICMLAVQWCPETKKKKKEKERHASKTKKSR